MIYIDNTYTDAAFNLALEEYIFEHLPHNQSCFMTWQNDRAVIVGKYQNTFEEVNAAFAKANGIHVVRRLSGGGAVYHDLGNLNYTIIVDHSKNAEFNFSAFASLVTDVLHDWDIPAEVTGRNDVTICGQKVSGSSQYIRNGRLLHHGCILIDSNLEYAAAALKPNPEKYKSRGVKSVRSRITTVNAHATCHVSVSQFKSALQHRIAEKFSLEPYQLTPEDVFEAQRICAAKYAADEWNWGSVPAYSLRREKRCDAGVVTADIVVENNILQQVHFSGDFFGKGDLTVMEKNLCGNPLDERLQHIIDQIDVEFFVKGLTAEDLYWLLSGSQ